MYCFLQTSPRKARVSALLCLVWLEHRPGLQSDLEAPSGRKNVVPTSQKHSFLLLSRPHSLPDTEVPAGAGLGKNTTEENAVSSAPLTLPMPSRHSIPILSPVIHSTGAEVRV